jgi:hypothetical protein
VQLKIVLKDETPSTGQRLASLLISYNLTPARQESLLCQWEDCGPFCTDHWQYVFDDERPKPNSNRNAGLNVSPAVRDYLGLSDIDVCDWKFVEFREAPSGPWAMYGDNS